MLFGIFEKSEELSIFFWEEASLLFWRVTFTKQQKKMAAAKHGTAEKENIIINDSSWCSARDGGVIPFRMDCSRNAMDCDVMQCNAMGCDGM